jgi:hypothetical protein
MVMLKSSIVFMLDNGYLLIKALSQFRVLAEPRSMSGTNDHG